MRIREVHEHEYDALGALTAAAYDTLSSPPSPSYRRQLADVADRARHTAVLVAVDDDDRLLGGVTYVGNAASPYAEFDDPDEACFRMLAVDPAAQGAGVGRALVGACIDRARASGKARLSLYSTPAMTTAHHLYERLGFRRWPGSDMIVGEARVELRSYKLELE